MSIAAVYGKQRRGKSLFALFYGLHLAENYQKQLVTNFPLKPRELAQYCRLMGYKWLSENIGKGVIRFVKVRETADLIYLFKFTNTIIVADELAVYLPARGSTHSTPVELREAFVQVGHDFQHLIFIAQNPEQVDSALRSQCEEVFHCNGLLKYSKELKNDALFFKVVRRMEPDSYQVFLGDPKVRRNPLKVKFLSSKTWMGTLSCADVFQFRIYESFTKLNSQSIEPLSDELEYRKIHNWLWVVAGKNPEKSHTFSRQISWFFKKLPSRFLERLLKIDDQLSRFKSLNSLEKRILKWGIPTVVLMVFTSVL